MGLVGGIPSDITIADNTFIDVNPRPHGPPSKPAPTTPKARTASRPSSASSSPATPSSAAGGPAMNLIGIKDCRIESNRIESPVRATVIARPADETDRQAILLRHSSGVAVKGNTLNDPENHTQPDANSQSPMLGLDGTKDITLDGKRLQDAPKRNSESKTK